MAGAKLSPRQKMINMMYLVLTALLALNVSREVMDAFYEVMVSQEASIETVEKQNESIYNAFEAAYAANPVKTKDWREKANEVKVRSEKLYAQIEDFKRGQLLPHIAFPGGRFFCHHLLLLYTGCLAIFIFVVISFVHFYLPLRSAFLRGNVLLKSSL